MQLYTAITPLRSEDVTGKTLGVHAHQHIRVSRYFAIDEGDMLRPIDVILITDDGEIAELGRKSRLRHAVDQPFRLQAVGDELGHRHERQMVLAGNGLEIGPPRHGAVGVEDFADDSRRQESRQPGEIHAGLGLPHPLQHTTGARA